MAVSSTALAIALLLVPPPRPVEAPQPTTITAAPSPPRGQRIAGGFAIGGIATAGVGVLVLLAVALPAELRLQRELLGATRAWDFDAKRRHYDRARHAAGVQQIGVSIGVSMLVVGVVVGIVAAAARRSIMRPRVPAACSLRRRIVAIIDGCGDG